MKLSMRRSGRQPLPDGLRIPLEGFPSPASGRTVISFDKRQGE